MGTEKYLCNRCNKNYGQRHDNAIPNSVNQTETCPECKESTKYEYFCTFLIGSSTIKTVRILADSPIDTPQKLLEIQLKETAENKQETALISVYLIRKIKD